MSPYEADPQLAYLVKKGHADYVMTEDGDLTCYFIDHVCLHMVYSA